VKDKETFAKTPNSGGRPPRVKCLAGLSGTLTEQARPWVFF